MDFANTHEKFNKSIDFSIAKKRTDDKSFLSVEKYNRQLEAVKKKKIKTKRYE